MSRISFVLLLASTLCACKGYAEDTSTFYIDGETFSVPADNLMPGSVTMLSSTDATGFNFVVYPSSERDQRVFVTIEPRDPLCASARYAVSALVRNACSGQKLRSPNPGLSSIESRVYLDELRDRWTYGQHDNPFASCFESGTTQIPYSQQCFSVGNYKGIIYTLVYPENQISRLSEIRHEIESRLSEWNVEK